MNLLDVLIGRLNQVKKGGVTFQPASGNIDTLIENYMNKIRQAKAASTAMPYIPSPNTQPGAVFSLIA